LFSPRCIVVGAASGQEAPNVDPTRGPRRRIPIGPEDVLDIAVWNNTAVSRTVPVRPDGRISLPLLNDVQASGLHASRAAGRAHEAAREYMPSPRSRHRP